MFLYWLGDKRWNNRQSYRYRPPKTDFEAHYWPYSCPALIFKGQAIPLRYSLMRSKLKPSNKGIQSVRRSFFLHVHITSVNCQVTLSYIFFVVRGGLRGLWLGLDRNSSRTTGFNSADHGEKVWVIDSELRGFSCFLTCAEKGWS